MILDNGDVSYYCPNCENFGVWEKGTADPICNDCATILYKYEPELKKEIDQQ